MSDTCTSPSNELWLLDTDSWLVEVPGGCWATRGLGGPELGGVEGRWWGEAGQMGVNAEAGQSVEEVGGVDCATEWDCVEQWAVVGEVSGWEDGQMDEGRAADDFSADWAREVGEGRVEAEGAEDGGVDGGWWSGETWLEGVISVSCVSSVLFGILLNKTKHTNMLKSLTGTAAAEF